MRASGSETGGATPAAPLRPPAGVSTGSSNTVYSRARRPLAQLNSIRISRKASRIGVSLLMRITGRAPRRSTITLKLLIAEVYSSPA
jgi:hypothetical protein